MAGDVQQAEHGRDALAAALRAMRLGTGLSGVAFAERLGWSQSKVNKTEHGRTRLSLADMQAWARAAGASREQLDNLNRLAIESATHVASWRSVHSAGLTQRQVEVAATEAAVTRLQNFQPAIIPGLLQTPEYARRVLTMTDVSGRKDVPTAVAARLNRQAVLFDEAKTFHFVLTEAVLRWRPGPADILRGQMDRLLTLMAQPNVTIAVVPLDAEAAVPYLSGFTIFHVPDDPWVLVEVLSTELTFRTEEELALYGWAFDQVAAAAVVDEAAVALIRAAAR